MKNVCIFLVVILSFLCMLIFPSETFQGASHGLLLWFQTVLPSLLPFIILSNVLVQTNALYYISNFLHPFLYPIFRISKPACYPLFIGFLCGYPMGAKTIADCTKKGVITKIEGKYLLSFCNNTSPMFIISVLLMQNIKVPSISIGTLIILIISPILCSFIFRRFYKSDTNYIKLQETSYPKLCFHFHVFDTSILNSFETITKIGGYIILFSILFEYGKHFPYLYFLPYLEISCGIPYIMSWNLPFSITYILALSLTTFGGCCSIAQSSAMLQGSGLSIKPYIIQKLITATVTSLLAFLYVFFIHR